ncbi:MAG: CvpA family protein [Calditrichaeota bacterium]|nr:CvpA family protein [Calditrichota bacterium]
MTSFDITILVIVAGFGLWGFMRGFICEIFEIAGVILGMLGGRRFGPVLAPKLPAVIPDLIRPVVGALLVSLAIFFAVKLIGWLVGKLLARGPLKLPNRIGGAAIGIAKGGMIVALALMLAAMTPYYAQIEKARPSSPLLDLSLKASRPVIRKYQELILRQVAGQIERAASDILVPPATTPLGSVPTSASAATPTNTPPHNISSLLQGLSEQDQRELRKLLADTSLRNIDIGRLDVEELTRRLKSARQSSAVPR